MPARSADPTVASYILSNFEPWLFMRIPAGLRSIIRWVMFHGVLKKGVTKLPIMGIGFRPPLPSGTTASVAKSRTFLPIEPSGSWKVCRLA
jgi:hypothetical protein